MILQSGYTVLVTKAFVSGDLEYKDNVSVNFYNEMSSVLKLVRWSNCLAVENELFEPLQLTDLYIIRCEEDKLHGARFWTE